MIATAIILAVGAMVLLVLTDAGIAVDVLALVVLMILPGAALTGWLVPTLRPGTAPWALVATGLGLALSILVGITLDQTPLGIRASPVILVAISLLSVVLLARRQRGSWPPRLRSPISAAQASLLALSLVLAVTAFGISRANLALQAPVELTQLWLVRDVNGTLQAGVANDGARTSTYRLVLESGGRELTEWPEIVLQPGQRWRQPVPTAILPEADLRAVLYRSEDPLAPYREVRISDPGAQG